VNDARRKTAGVRGAAILAGNYAAVAGNAVGRVSWAAANFGGRSGQFLRTEADQHAMARTGAKRRGPAWPGIEKTANRSGFVGYRIIH